MAVSLKVSIEDREFEDLIAAIQTKMRDLTPLFKNIGEYMLQATEDRFREQNDPDGNPWAELSPAYLKRKKGSKILTESSNLRGRVVYKAGDGYVLIGTNVIYAAVHQVGMDEKVQVKGHRRRQKQRDVRQGRRKVAKGVAFVAPYERHMRMPARPYLGLSDDDQQEINAIIRDHIAGAFMTE